MPVTGIGGQPVRLAGPVAGPTANATAFIAIQPTILRDLKAANTNSASAEVTLSINGSTAATMLVPAASVGASTLATFALDTPINPTDTVQWLSTAATVTLTLTGEVQGPR